MFLCFTQPYSGSRADHLYLCALPADARHGNSKRQNPLGCGDYGSEAGIRQRVVLAGGARGGGQGPGATPGKQVVAANWGLPKDGRSVGWAISQMI